MIAPARMIATRLQSSSTSARMWLESRIVIPSDGEPLHELAHVAHAGRVEAGRRLVEQQQLRLAQQRRGDAEPLAHAVRVAADAILARGRAARRRRAPPRCATRARRRRGRRAAAGSCGPRGTDRTAAPRRSRRRRRARARRRRAGRARRAARSLRSAGSGRAACAATSSCPRRSGRGSRTRRRARPSGRRGRRRRCSP